MAARKAWTKAILLSGVLFAPDEAEHHVTVADKKSDCAHDPGAAVLSQEPHKTSNAKRRNSDWPTVRALDRMNVNPKGEVSESWPMCVVGCTRGQSMAVSK